MGRTGYIPLVRDISELSGKILFIWEQYLKCGLSAAWQGNIARVVRWIISLFLKDRAAQKNRPHLKPWRRYTEKDTFLMVLISTTLKTKTAYLLREGNW